MIKFIDINSGEMYDGASPYVHWFQQEMSIGLIYTHNIYILSDHNKLNIRFDDPSSVFHILDIKGKYSKYNDITRTNIDVIGDTVAGAPGTYVYQIHFSATSQIANQFISSLVITGGNESINIVLGADFYDQNESLYINLANMGVELPFSIQKSIYTSNINEDKIDHILLNRKMKELLSNYWDIVANKGSYKSLINSLKWFEWGDLIRIREIWEHEDFGRIVYSDRDLCSVMRDKYDDSYMATKKTTNVALYMTMQNILNDFDAEGNPSLVNISNKWSINDLMAKICLLGNFYETYFMPIHLNLFRATIENIVFSNNIKLLTGTLQSREDYLYNIHGFKCNIQDNQEFVLSNVTCYVNNDTFFGNIDNDVYGIDEFIGDASNHNKFLSGYHDGVGCIVEFECNLPPNELVTDSVCIINNINLKDNTSFNTGADGVKKFKLLFKKDGTYKINLQFNVGGLDLYTKSININISDVKNMKLNIYKIIPDTPNKDFVNSDINWFSRNVTSDIIYQVIPATYNTSICLNNLLILRGNFLDNHTLSKYYFTYNKIAITGDGTDVYTICISKKFGFNPNGVAELNRFKPFVYRNEDIFFKAFHKLIPLGDDYNVTNETLIAVPDLQYSLKIDDYEWEFINVSTGDVFRYTSIQNPMIAGDKLLTKGYYNIIFRYKLSEKVHELKLDSAFKKN